LSLWFTGTGLTGWKTLDGQKRGFQNVVDVNNANSAIRPSCSALTFDNPHLTKQHCAAGGRLCRAAATAAAEFRDGRLAVYLAGDFFCRLHERQRQFQLGNISGFDSFRQPCRGLTPLFLNLLFPRWRSEGGLAALCFQRWKKGAMAPNRFSVPAFLIFGGWRDPAHVLTFDASSSSLVHENVRHTDANFFPETSRSDRAVQSSRYRQRPAPSLTPSKCAVTMPCWIHWKKFDGARLTANQLAVNRRN